jgi:hypothetical protein
VEGQKDHVKNHFSTIYITVASVLLGLTLGDVVSVLRNTEEHSVFLWLQALTVIHLIFNAWYGYSGFAITVQAIPTVWDSVSVFGLSAAHFAIAAFIGASPEYYCAALGIYSLVAIGSMHYTFSLIKRQFNISFGQMRPLYLLNGFASAVFFTMTWLFYTERVGVALEVPVGLFSLGFATAWLVIFTRFSERNIFRELRQ